MHIKKKTRIEMQKLVDYVHPQVIAMTGQLFVASTKPSQASKSAVANEFGGEKKHC